MSVLDFSVYIQKREQIKSFKIIQRLSDRNVAGQANNNFRSSRLSFSLIIRFVNRESFFFVGNS